MVTHVIMAMMVLVDRCRIYTVLLAYLSFIYCRRPPTDIITPHRPTSPRHLLNCPSSSSSLACWCSIDLVVRCRGHSVTKVPQFPPEVDVVLAELNMAGTSVGKLLPDDFYGLRVRRVVLTENQLSDDGLSESAFSTLANHLTSLIIGACAIRTLPPRLLVDLTRLTVLQLWSNHIEVIPDNFFVANSELRELSLWGNRLRTIHNRTLFGLFRLRMLDLDHNLITGVERGGLSHVSDVLEVLRLSNNHISALSASTFTDLLRLRVLTLASNRLLFVDARTFAGLHELRTLTVANNRIQFLADGAFQHLARLRTLNLSGNRLERVWAGTFVGLRSLTTVDLSRNRLSRLPEATFGHSPVVRRLVVEDNWLSTLGRCTLSSRANVRSLSLIGNVLECDCRMAWISHITTVLGNCVHDDETAQHEQVLPVHKTSAYIDYRFCSSATYHSCLL